MYDVSQKQEVFENKNRQNFDRIVDIENVKVKVLVDSGASVNIMNRRTFEGLNERLKYTINLKKSKSKVVTYGSTEPNLKILGEAEFLVETKNKFVTTKFVIVDTEHKNILSGATAITLGILYFRKPTSVNTCRDSKNKTSINSHEQATGDYKVTQENIGEGVPKRLQPLINKYKNTVFSTKIGKIKGHQVKLHINLDVPPVAQKERRIPFALRKNRRSRN